MLAGARTVLLAAVVVAAASHQDLTEPVTFSDWGWVSLTAVGKWVL
jgi:hypothetical protein